MNAEQLLQHFDRVSEAPDAIPRLRRFILDLAVRGKLVEQDPSDEPAAKLLKRIEAEKARLAKGGKTKKISCPASLAPEEQPFKLPNNWEWVQLGNILTKLTDGTHHSPPNGPIGEFKYITAKNIRNDGILLDNVTYVSKAIHDEIYSRCNPEKGDILYIKDGATTGVVTINSLDEPFSMLSSVALLKLPGCLFNRLVAEFLRSPFFYAQMRGFMKGAAITRVTLKRMLPALLPLPPLAEQHRIVARVDELMNLCEQLEAAKAEREETRDSLVAASLQGLSQPVEEEEAFREHARFTFNILPRISTRTAHIKQLRQTILNLAVRGKLVPQDPSDEPASELLKRIEAEKARLAKGGKTKKILCPASLAPEEQPFKLPNNWEWVQLGNILTKLTDGTHHSPPNGPIGEFKYITAKNIRNDGILLDNVTYVSKAIHDEIYSRCNPEKGDILYIKDGATTGVVTINSLDEPFSMLSSVALLKLPGCLFNRLVAEFLRSPFFYAQMRGFMKGAAITRVTLKRMLPALLPLPPLAEQHRIVARVDELMAICDQLEEQITEAEQDSRRYLEAVLNEALTPAMAEAA